MARLATVTDARDADAALSPSAPYRALKQLGLVVLCGAWVVLGLVGHDPWKSEDATAFGVAYDVLRGGDPLTPRLAGEPYIDHPPLVYAAAALTGTVLSGVLPAHDAARIAAGALLGLTLLMLAMTGRELIGTTFRWVPVLLLAGSVGLWDRAHQLSPELGLMLGVATATYGFALALRRAVAGGAWLGLGIAIAFLSHGLMGPLWLVITAAILPVAFAAWRTRRYALTATVALGVALPLSAAWLVALAVRDPAHLASWWADQSIGDWVAPLSQSASIDPMFLAKNLPWYTWPAMPLALWTLWMRGRGFNGGLRVPAVLLPGTLALVIVAAIAVMSEPKLTYLMPLLLPLSLLGALEIDTLKRGFSGALDWFGILTFGLLAALVWWLWVDTWLNGMTPAVAALFRDTTTGYRPVPAWLPLSVSVFLTLLWIVLVRPARRSNRRAVLNWAAGMVLLWGLYSTIWLPYLDSRRSYRYVADALAPILPREGCIASRNLGESQRVLFAYFANLATVREETNPDNECRTLIVQYGRIEALPAAPEGWSLVWEGHRRGDDTERFALYRKVAP
ncbi:MAG TPA: glycosyltransferase family 39 protein [Casimicrobiaceae bacterium]